MKSPRLTKTIIEALFAVGLSVSLVSPTFAASLTIEVNGDVGDKGSVMVALYKAGD